MAREPEAAFCPVAVAVVHHEGRFLIGRRGPGRPLAGCWEFPGGRVRLGETPRAAAARECLEETGLAIRVGPPYEVVRYAYDHGAVEISFFSCEPLDPSQRPKAPFRWVAAGELPGYDFPPANARLVRHLADQARGPVSSSRS